MNKKKLRLVTFVLSMITALVLVTSCTQLPTQSPTVPQSSPAGSAEISQEQTPSLPSSSSKPTSVSGSSSNMYSDFKISKPPAVGEIVDLTYDIQWLNLPGRSINKIWLEFELYDPGVYYPLGKGQFYKNQRLDSLSKLSPGSGLYFITYLAKQDQPNTIVDEDSIVVSGDKSWEGKSKTGMNQVNLLSKIRFPDEGQWLISAVLDFDDGSSEVNQFIYLTVNKDSGKTGWPEDYATVTGVQEATPDAPVGVYFKIDHAPLLDEEMPLEITVYSLEDTIQSDISFLAINKSKGEIPVNTMLKGLTSWKGKLKKGEPIQYPVILKFPEVGDYQLHIMVRPNPGSRNNGMANISLYIGKDKSQFGWTTDYDKINDTYKNLNERINKREQNNGNDQLESDLPSEVPGNDANMKDTLVK